VSDGDTLQDVETGAMMTVAADDLQRGYPQRLREHLRSLERVTLSAGGHYLQMSTDQPLDRGLRRYLRFRERHP
jgi:hypothetical protein